MQEILHLFSCNGNYVVLTEQKRPALNYVEKLQRPLEAASACAQSGRKDRAGHAGRVNAFTASTANRPDLTASRPILPLITSVS